jgi:hypothetical protein
MRFVVRSYADKPRKLTLSSTSTVLHTVCTTKNTKLITESIYRDSYKTKDGTASKVIDKLNKFYHYKCAYCERIYKLDVEHYRPKGEVTDENFDIVYVTDATGTLIAHPGYYWLCYEWSNLIPSCITCNREGGKNSKFPTIHHHEYQPVFTAGGILDSAACFAPGNPLITEQPYLLHPEIDDPVNFFTFTIDPNKKGIRIEGSDATRRGEITADICKLNRDEVRYDRVNKVLLPLRKAMLGYLKLLQNGRKNLHQFKDFIEGSLQKLYDDADEEKLDHTLLRKYAVANQVNFEAIVIPFMPVRAKKIIREAFINYIPV